MKRILSLVLILCGTASAGTPFIFKGSVAKNLAASGIEISNSSTKQVLDISVDPSAGGGLAASIGSLGIFDNAGVGELWLKTGTLDTDWSKALFTAGSLTQGYVVFPDAGGNLSGDSSLFWDNTNKRLGVGTSSPAVPLHVVGSIRTDNTLILQDPGAGTNTITLQAPTLGGDYVLTLPTDDGAAGQCVQTDGSGILSWVDTLQSLNGLTAQSQTFATGTSGSDFNISSSTSTHTFNIPDASATARGVVTTGSQTIAGAKTFSTTPIFSALSTGVVHSDSSGNLTSSTIVDADISATAAIAFSKLAALTSGNILVGNGSNVATSVTPSGDVTISNAGVTAIGANKVTDSMIRQSSGLSVIGRSANSTGNVADITAANDGEVLFRNGTSIGFGTISNSSINASAAIDRSKIASGTANHVVINDGSGNLSSEANLAVSRGGTGAGTFTANNVLLGNGTSAFQVVAPGTSGNVLTSNGTTWTSAAPSGGGTATWGTFYFSNDCAWSRTDTSRGDFTTDGSCTFTAGSSSNLTLTAATSGGSNYYPGVTFTPPSTGGYEICFAGSIDGAGNVQSINIWDGTNVLAYTQTTSSVRDAFGMCGIYNATTTSSVTLTLQGKASTGDARIDVNSGSDYTITGTVKLIH